MPVYIILAIVALILLLIVLSVILSNRKRKKQERIYQAELKRRDEDLNQQISNPYNDEELDKEFHPYKVNYFETENSSSNVENQLFQLVERNKRTEKTYMFSQDETVYIGKQNGELTIWKIQEHQEPYCKIKCNGGICYIRSTELTEIYVKRKKKKTLVDREGICLKQDDLIEVLNIELNKIAARWPAEAVV